ncbi:hypothetical protein GETHLI_22930 [Geothrix limicola]|uniref:Lipoprotein n=1 Tax=Geothrix limicola TaxID=2927978 RepID=A0ABQ5QH88_9BACT|nr:hypothetical protein [Geothrix limicola]GLH73791.1 hypothetical protein GETHLI_22930 [Geothrix limicola]
MSRAWLMPLLPLVLPLALLGCKEEPHRIENENLGIAATFPGPPKLHRHTDPGPFGEVEWFDLALSPAGRLDETFSVAVGNLPPGNKGGTTPREILTTFQNFLGYRFGAIQRTELPADRGPGFRYHAKSPTGGVIEGIVVVRRGRLHHAQAIVRRPGDPRTAAFLDDFEVRTR